MRKTSKRVLRTSFLSLLSGAVIIVASISTASAQTGFTIPSQNLFRIPDAFNGGNIDSPASLDVILNTSAGASVPATTWGLLLAIGSGSSAGDFTFDVPAIVNDEPNLNIASANPFRDFDRDFGGMSYGDATSPTNLSALSLYIEPQTVAIPPTDANGNITVPDGAGLVSVPLRIGATGWAANSEVASNTQQIDFVDDPESTGVTYKTGPDATDIAIHPSLGNTGSVVTVYETLPGDADLNGVVGLGDFNIWFNNFGPSGGWTEGNWDSAGDGPVGLGDFNVWFNNFGPVPLSSPSASAAVPEPSTALLLLASIPAFFGWRRRRQRS